MLDFLSSMLYSQCMPDVFADKRSRWTVFAPAFWLIDYLFARLMLEFGALGPTLRIALALLPLPMFVLCLAVFVWAIRGIDELQRRIHLEALVIAFPAAVIVLMSFGLLELALPQIGSQLPWRDVWGMLPLFYCISWLFAARRYR
jgi:hypothetical protein